MAGGTRTGLNGIPRDPRQDARTRRALARLSGTALEVPPSGLVINDQGQLDILIDPTLGGGLQNTVDGLGLVINASTIFALLQAGRDIVISLVAGKIKISAVEVPAGIMAPFSGTGSPATGEWIPCDGASYSTALYPDLFAAIGYTYGGSGATFNVPNETSTSFLGTDIAYTDVANVFTVGPQTIIPDADAHKGLVVKSHSATQSANLLDLQTSSASTVFSVGPDGRITINISAGATFPPVINGVTLLHTLPDTVTGASLVGWLAGVSSNSTNTHNQTSFKGASLPAEHHGSGTISLICGGDFSGDHYGSALATSVFGGRGVAHNDATGAVTSLDGFRAIWGNYGAGTVASAAGFRATEDSGGGPITVNYGFLVSSLTQGTTNYGFYSGITAAANTFAFYGGGTAVSYFGGQVGVGVAAPDASALFQIDSTTEGFLPPRGTTVQKNAISSPAESLLFYDTDLHALCVYNGSAWKTVTAI